MTNKQTMCVNPTDSKLKTSSETRLPAFIHPLIVQQDLMIYDYLFKISWLIHFVLAVVQ